MTTDEATAKMNEVMQGDGWVSVWNYDSVCLDGDYTRDQLRKILDILCEVKP